MTTCPAFNSKPDVITKDNYHEPGPYSYSQSVGSSITATCNQGYELVGTKNFVCQADGTWSYGSSPPACLDERLKTRVQVTTSTTEAPAPDENTWILIGVVCGVAVIIIAILIIMMVAIWYRDRKRNKRDEMMLYNVNRMYPKDHRGYRPPSPYDRDDDIEMYGRPKSPLPARMPPPPPYESRSGDSDDRHHYIKNREYDRRRDYERYRDRDRSPYQDRKRRSRSFNDYEDHGSRLSSRMYLPDRGYDDRAPEPRSLYYKSRSFDDGLSEHGRRAYDSPWVKRSFRNDAFDDLQENLYDLPRDHRLWRNFFGPRGEDPSCPTMEIPGRKSKSNCNQM